MLDSTWPLLRSGAADRECLSRHGLAVRDQQVFEAEHGFSRPDLSATFECDSTNCDGEIISGNKIVHQKDASSLSVRCAKSCVIASGVDANFLT